MVYLDYLLLLSLSPGICLIFLLGILFSTPGSNKTSNFPSLELLSCFTRSWKGWKHLSHWPPPADSFLCTLIKYSTRQYTFYWEATFPSKVQSPSLSYISFAQLYTWTIATLWTKLLSKLLQTTRITCTKGIHGQVSINTLDQPSSWSTLNQHLHQ